VGAVETNHEKEGIVVIIGEAVCGPGGDFWIRELVGFFSLKAAPVHGEVVNATQVFEGIGEIIGDDLERLGTHASGVFVGNVLRHFWSAVVDLSSHHDAIALVADVAR